MQSAHHQVSERALLVWREEALRLCLEVYGDCCWAMVYAALRKVSVEYWLTDIRAIARSVMADLQASYPELNGHRLRKQRERADATTVWKKVRQLAIHQINVNINK